MNHTITPVRAPWRRAALAVALALGATLAVASPAEATIIQTEHYAGSFEAEFEFCGLDVHYEDEWSGRVKIRQGKGRDAGAFFVQDHFSGVETFTNTANGKFFTISHDGVFQELRATRVEGSVFEFVAHEVGQPFVVRDMDGRVVLRDRGNITSTVLFDTLGDDEPGGDFLGVVDVRVSGPHPGFFLEPGEECPGVNDLIG